MRLQHKIILGILSIIACLSCGYVGYLINEYNHQEQQVSHTIAEIKKTNNALPKKADSTLTNIVKRQGLTIDSLLNVKIQKSEVNNVSGFSMGGKSISTEELLRYVNDQHKEASYYKQIYEVLSKKYEIAPKKNEDGTVTVITKDPQVEKITNQYNLLLEKHNILVDKFNELVKKTNRLDQERLDYKNEASNLKTALKLIKSNYKIDYDIKKENDSVNTISVDKVRKNKNK